MLPVDLHYLPRRPEVDGPVPCLSPPWFRLFGPWIAWNRKKRGVVVCGSERATVACWERIGRFGAGPSEEMGDWAGGWIFSLMLQAMRRRISSSTYAGRHSPQPALLVLVFRGVRLSCCHRSFLSSACPFFACQTRGRGRAASSMHKRVTAHRARPVATG